MTNSYANRIINSSKEHNSNIILALDLPPSKNIFVSSLELISKVHKFICAIKINFHLILPLSIDELKKINYKIHDYGLQSICDIKLNDLSSTNLIVSDYLNHMNFDAVIVNPFIGFTELGILKKDLNSKNMGMITLVYMSHPTSNEGYGLKILNENINNLNTDNQPIYELFLEYSIKNQADGIVVGATQNHILRKVSQQTSIPIYSPGLITQGGSLKQAKTDGTNYFIIGRHIINSLSPESELINLLSEL